MQSTVAGAERRRTLADEGVEENGGNGGRGLLLLFVRGIPILSAAVVLMTGDESNARVGEGRLSGEIVVGCVLLRVGVLSCSTCSKAKNLVGSSGSSDAFLLLLLFVQ